MTQSLPDRDPRSQYRNLSETISRLITHPVFEDLKADAFGEERACAIPEATETTRVI